MSDGGRGNTIEHEKHRSRSVRKSGRDERAKAIAKFAVAQVCENGGFQTCQLSALDTLSDIAIRYMHDIGKTALLYANLAGRTEVNHFDIIQGLKDLTAVQGFAGALENNHCLVHSGVVHEISQYVSDYEEVPFSYDLHRFPVDRERNRPRSFLQIGEEPPEEHIPGWLSTFPDPKTYNVSLKESAEVRSSSPGRDVNGQFAKLQDSRQSQPPLLNMPNLFSSNGLPGPSSADTGNPVKPNEAVLINPYLSAPVRVVEKDASPAVTLPEKPPEEAAEGSVPLMNNLNADSNIFGLKTIAPANLAASSKSTDSNNQKLLSSQRTPVQFNIKFGKKSLVSGRMPSDGFTDKSSQSSSSGSGECDTNNEMKERARKILKVSMESSQNVAWVCLV